LGPVKGSTIHNKRAKCTNTKNSL